MIKPAESVLLTLRVGAILTTQVALVLAASAGDKPRIELVTINPATLKHSGTADWERALLRMIDVPHISSEDFVEGRASAAYEPLGAVDVIPGYGDFLGGLATGMANLDKMFTAAVAAHEGNRLLCAALGDYSQLAWAECPVWQQESAKAGVLAVAENPDITPAGLHVSWLEMKRADGWKYGPVKDADKKEHPCFVPYEGLSAAQQLKDHLFGVIVRSVLGLTLAPQQAITAPEPTGLPVVITEEQIAQLSKAIWNIDPTVEAHTDAVVSRAITLLGSLHDQALAAKSEPADAPGPLTEAGRRWEELHREYAEKATEAFNLEYPDPVTVPASPSIADLDAAAAETAAKDATKAPALYTVKLDGVQVGEPFPAHSCLVNGDSVATLVTDYKVGDTLEGGATIHAIEATDEGFNILASSAI